LWVKGNLKPTRMGTARVAIVDMSRPGTPFIVFPRMFADIATMIFTGRGGTMGVWPVGVHIIRVYVKRARRFLEKMFQAGR